MLEYRHSTDHTHVWCIQIWVGLQGKVPGTNRNFDKVDEWVQVVGVCVSVT
jgi:hypothetical protein